MTGNAAEEGVILQIDNPSHMDRARVAVPAGAVVGIVTALALPGPVWLRVLVGLVAGVTVSVMLHRALERRAMARAAEAQEAARRERMKAVEKQLAEAQSSSKAK